jgi:3-methyladenine DNA glycosylase/8-oxoguanine DNA glycosylase
VPLYDSEYPQHMAEQERTQPEEAAAEALDALTAAYHQAVAAINAIPDPQRAFEYATQLANALRDTYQQASELRTLTAARIWEAEELSLAALAQRIGVSKARADQLIRAARASTKEQQP